MRGKRIFEIKVDSRGRWNTVPAGQSPLKIVCSVAECDFEGLPHSFVQPTRNSLIHVEPILEIEVDSSGRSNLVQAGQPPLVTEERSDDIDLDTVCELFRREPYIPDGLMWHRHSCLWLVRSSHEILGAYPGLGGAGKSTDRNVCVTFGRVVVLKEKWPAMCKRACERELFIPSALRQAQGIRRALKHASRTIRSIERVEWLPGKGSNLDWLDQNQLCYHYTTRQSKDLLLASPAQGSRRNAGLAGSWVWWFKPQEDRVSAYPEFVEEVSRIRYFHPDGKLHCSCPAYCAAGSG